MIKKFSNLVMFSHTIFAMPFALIGFTYAVTTTEASFSWMLLAQVLLCMIFARNAAMGFNRWADRDIDAKNERTANREIPANRISPRAALTFVVTNALLFVATTCTINSLAAILSPAALFVIMFYSYCKRFTAAAHLVLGLGLAIAPIGAYIAVTGEFALAPCILAAVVLSWCSGFDIIYSLQDADFDRQEGLHSIPSKFSTRGALTISTLLHICSALFLIYFAYLLPRSVWITIGVAIFIIILTAEHLLVTPTHQRNIGIAFGTLNGLASLTLAIFTIMGLILSL
ncbi:MAG: 4-hydroxybenzoate octaprenyltransferase [Rikenellaceae bacterium]